MQRVLGKVGPGWAAVRGVPPGDSGDSWMFSLCSAPPNTIQNGQPVEEASVSEPADGSYSALPGSEGHPGPGSDRPTVPAEPSAAVLEESGAARPHPGPRAAGARSAARSRARRRLAEVRG